MNLCRVVGDVVSTVKNPKFEGHRLLLLQPVDLDCKTPRGPSFVGVDLTQAGVGDLVLSIKEGGGVRIVMGDDKIPLAVVIVAIVDELDLAEEPGLVGTSVYELAKAAEGDA